MQDSLQVSFETTTPLPEADCQLTMPRPHRPPKRTYTPIRLSAIAGTITQRRGNSGLERPSRQSCTFFLIGTADVSRRPGNMKAAIIAPVQSSGKSGGGRRGLALGINIAWVLLGIWISVLATKLTLWDASGPSTGFLPLLTGIIIASCGLSMLLWSPRANLQLKDLWPTPNRALRPFAVVFGLVAMAWLMPVLGFLVTAFLITLFLVRVVYLERWHWSLLVSSLASGTLTAIFVYAFGIQLPRLALGT